MGRSLGALGAMAVLSMRLAGVEIDDRISRRASALVADEPEWKHGMDIDVITDPKALATVLLQEQANLADCVVEIQAWLATGQFPWMAEAVELVRRDRVKQIGLARVLRLEADGRIATIEAKAPQRLMLPVAFWRAPVAVVVEYHISRIGRRRRLAAIGQIQPGHLRMDALLGVLNEREPGWTSSETVIHSPENTQLELRRISGIVKHYLTAGPGRAVQRP